MSIAPGSPIVAADRVSDVFTRHPDAELRLIAAFEAHSAHFHALRNPLTRRVMTRLVTVEQAARIASVPVALLLLDLNRAAGLDAGAEVEAPMTDPLVHAPDRPNVPADGAAAPPLLPGETVELDVREDLRQGREPFSRIMAAVAGLREGQTLLLRATFEPVPLFTVMAKRGFAHRAEQLAADDWRVWFFRAPVPPPPDHGVREVAPPDVSAAAIGAGSDDVVLDVRGLEPPEPLVRTLEALEQLPPGRRLVQVNVRVPQHLLPMLRERGFDYALEQPRPDLVLVRIHHTTPGAA